MENRWLYGYSKKSENENTGPKEDGSVRNQTQLFHHQADLIKASNRLEVNFQRCFNTMEKVLPILAASANRQKAQKGISTSTVIENKGKRHKTLDEKQTRTDVWTSFSGTSARHLRQRNATKHSAKQQQNEFSDSDTDRECLAVTMNRGRQTRRHIRKKLNGAYQKCNGATKIHAKQKQTGSSSSDSEIRIPPNHEQKNLSTIQRAWIGKIISQKKEKESKVKRS